MDGRVAVTPTRWLQQPQQQSQQQQPQRGKVAVSDKYDTTQSIAQSTSQQTQQPQPVSRGIKPKTPAQPQKTPSRTSELLEEFGGEFGMTKELSTPIEQSRSYNTGVIDPQKSSRRAESRTQEPVKSPSEHQSKPLSVTREDSSPGVKGNRSVNSASSVNPQTINASIPQSHQQYPQPQPQPQQYQQPQTTTSFTDEEINEMLANGYLSIVREMWEYIPAGSHVRFFKKGNGSPNVRFRPGGYIKKHYLTADGKRILLMETVRGGTNSTPGYITYPMALDDLDQIWKRYPEEFYVEMHLIYNSLVRKDKQINDLLTRVTTLESRFKK